MSEQAIVNAAVTALTPIAAAILEDLHQAASAEITRLEANLPAEIATAASTVQTWTDDMLGAFHRLVARIDGARQGAPATVTTSAATLRSEPGPEIPVPTGAVVTPPAAAK